MCEDSLEEQNKELEWVDVELVEECWSNDTLSLLSGGEVGLDCLGGESCCRARVIGRSEEERFVCPMVTAVYL